MSGTYNISFTAGDTLEFDVLLKNADNSSKDLTGYTAKAQVRVAADSPDVLADFNVVGVLGPSGAIRLRMESTETAIFRTTPSGVWDLEITKTADNTKLTVLGGSIKGKLDVTRE